MPDGEVVRDRLEALARYVDFLRQLRPVKADELAANLERQMAILHAFQLAIECVQDVAAHLVATKSLGKPKSHTEAIDLLGQTRILDDQLHARLRGMPGFRNIVVHDYLEVDLEKVATFLESLEDFDRFGEAILRSLESEDF